MFNRPAKRQKVDQPEIWDDYQPFLAPVTPLESKEDFDLDPATPFLAYHQAILSYVQEDIRKVLTFVIPAVSLNGLIKEKAPGINEQNVRGDTPLMVAIRYCDSEAPNALILSGRCDLAKVNNEGDTALHLALKYGQESIADKIIDYYPEGANIHKLNYQNRTPLMEAALQGYVRIVNKILLKNPYGTHCNSSVLLDAYESNHAETFERLLKEKHSNLYCLDNRGNTLLMLAARDCKAKIMKMLLAKDSSPKFIHAQNDRRKTAFHLVTEGSECAVLLHAADKASKIWFFSASQNPQNHVHTEKAFSRLTY